MNIEIKTTALAKLTRIEAPNDCVPCVCESMTTMTKCLRYSFDYTQNPMEQPIIAPRTLAPFCSIGAQGNHASGCLWFGSDVCSFFFTSVPTAQFDMSYLIRHPSRLKTENVDAWKEKNNAIDHHNSTRFDPTKTNQRKSVQQVRRAQLGNRI